MMHTPDVRIVSDNRPATYAVRSGADRRRGRSTGLVAVLLSGCTALAIFDLLQLAVGVS